MQTFVQYNNSVRDINTEISILKKKRGKLDELYILAHCPLHVGDIIEKGLVRIRIESIRIVLPAVSAERQWWVATGQRLTKRNTPYRGARLPEKLQFPTDLYNPRCAVKIIRVKKSNQENR